MGSDIFEFKVTARYGLITDPVMKVGGQKFSYQVPTYEMLRGLTGAIYKKPTINWFIDEVRVMNKIQSESKGQRVPKFHEQGCSLAYYTYLKDLEYRVRAHFEWNMARPDLTQDRDYQKHYNMAMRKFKEGGRRATYIGVTECPAYVELCDFNEGAGFYDNSGTMGFGVMFYCFDYPEQTGRDELAIRLWQQTMENGVIKFQRPEDVPLKRVVREYEDGFMGRKYVAGENMTYAVQGGRV